VRRKYGVAASCGVAAKGYGITSPLVEVVVGVVVAGALSNHGRRASGTLKINGDISEGNACKSGKLQWHAHRDPGH
jgi:hypothetical protein